MTGNQTADWTLSTPGGDDLFQYASFITDDPQIYGFYIPNANTVHLFSGFTHPTNHTITARHNIYTYLTATAEFQVSRITVAPDDSAIFVKNTRMEDKILLSAKIENIDVADPRWKITPNFLLSPVFMELVTPTKASLMFGSQQDMSPTKPTPSAHTTSRRKMRHIKKCKQLRR